jgi:tRNA uridine 5-carbamoylmethylation protein Kti12
MIDTKIYRLFGINMAMELLRPGAKWEISNRMITRWDDPRPQPTWEEIDATMTKIKEFEDSIDTIWLPEQLAELTGQPQEITQ